MTNSLAMNNLPTFKVLLKFTFFLFIFLFTFTISFGQHLHIEYPEMPSDKDNALIIDYGDAASGSFKKGILINTVPLGSSQTGQRDALRAFNSSNYFTQSGSAFTLLSSVKSYNGDAGFVGVIGQADATSLRNSNSLFSRALGGQFLTQASTNLTLGSGNFYVGGILAELNGNINNTPSSGAVAAVIGVDKSSGTADSWAGFFEGRNYFSTKTAIGIKTFPSTADGLDVSSFNLFVTGGILAEEVIIATQDMWADYVFEKDYQLRSLEEVASYIEKNKHLPAFPSAKEVAESGIALGNITILQQEKIEELFLHSIQLNQENKNIKAENEQLKKENTALKERMEAFDKRLSALEHK